MTQQIDNQVDYLQYWHVIRRKIWMIIALSIAVTGLAVLVVGNMKPVYSSTAIITLEHSKDKSAPIKSVYDIDYRAGKSEMTGTEMEVFKSSRLLELVSNKLQLDRNSLYNPNLTSRKESNAISGLLAMFRPEQKELTDNQVHASIIGNLKASLEVTVKQGTRVLNIKFEAQTPAMAMKLANTLADVYIQDNINYRQDETLRATKWMRERADTLKQTLLKTQQRLQQFIEQEKLVDVGGVSGLTQVELTELTNRVVESRLKRDELSRKYGSRHPMIIAAQSELNRARSALAAKKNEIRAIGRKQVKLKALQQEVDSASDLYEKFFNRLSEANEVATRTRANARIIEPASLNPYPIKPRKGLIIGAAFVASLLFGAVLTLMLDLLDATVRSVEHVEKRLGLSMLGLLPKIDLKGQSLLDVVMNDKRQTFNESMRTIRTGIMLSALDNPHKVLLVTSSLPGEGKSTVAANLAMNLGKMEKVLLIDCDFRRPSIAKAFDLSTSAAGMSELVAGTAKFKDCIHQSKKYGIDIFTAGTIPPNPLELLASERFAKLLSVLERHYDRIIVDSPPVHAVSDSLVLSKHAKGMLFVVKADATSHRVIKPCIKRLQEVDAPIIGVVLNQVDVDKKGSYGYGYGGYYDQYGYSAGAKT